MEQILFPEKRTAWSLDQAVSFPKHLKNDGFRSLQSFHTYCRLGHTLPRSFIKYNPDHRAETMVTLDRFSIPSTEDPQRHIDYCWSAPRRALAAALACIPPAVVLPATPYSVNAPSEFSAIFHLAPIKTPPLVRVLLKHSVPV